MANKYCKIISPYADYDIVKLKVQTGQTFYPGDVVKAETLDTALTNNISVYVPTPVDTVASDKLVIIPNQGFEVLSDGRKPDGNPDFSTYSFIAGDTIYGLRLRQNYVFHISYDSVDYASFETPAVAVKLVPQASDYQFKTATAVGSNATALNIEYLKTIPAGGQFASNFISGMITRVVAGY